MESGRTIVILDGSNIMAARNDGIHDVEILRSVVETVRLITEVMYGLVKEGNISALPLPCG